MKIYIALGAYDGDPDIKFLGTFLTPDEAKEKCKEEIRNDWLFWERETGTINEDKIIYTIPKDEASSQLPSGGKLIRSAFDDIMIREGSGKLLEEAYSTTDSGYSFIYFIIESEIPTPASHHVDAKFRIKEITNLLEEL